MHNSNYHSSVKNSKTIWTKLKTLEMVKKALTSWDNSGLNVYISGGVDLTVEPGALTLTGQEI